jgi:hypothetical protein
MALIDVVNQRRFSAKKEEVYFFLKTNRRAAVLVNLFLSRL